MDMTNPRMGIKSRKKNVARRKDPAQPDLKRELDDESERQQPHEPHRHAPEKKKNAEERQSNRFEDHGRGVRHENEQFAAKGQTPHHRRVLDDARGRADHALIQPEPRQKPRDQKVDVVLVVRRRSSAEHKREHEPIENDETERLQHSPEDAKRRAGEARMKVSLYELPEEVGVFERFSGPSGLDSRAASP